MILLLWFPTGIILPGVYDDGQLWKGLKALIPVHVSLVPTICFYITCNTMAVAKVIVHIIMSL